MLHLLSEIPSDEFERLIGQLVERMGYENKATRYSRDGSVYFVATRHGAPPTHSFLIQVKRHHATVDLGTVRNLYGVLEAAQSEARPARMQKARKSS